MDMIVSSMIEISGKAVLWSMAVAGIPLMKEELKVAVTLSTNGRSLGVSPGSLTPLESQRPAAYLYESCLSLAVRPMNQWLR